MLVKNGLCVGQPPRFFLPVRLCLLLDKQRMDGETRHNALINRLSEVIESSRRDIMHPFSAFGTGEENLQTEPDARIHKLFPSVNNINRSRPSHKPTLLSQPPGKPSSSTSSKSASICMSWVVTGPTSVDIINARKK